ncbi:MAG: N-acetylglucosamine-6-phosphate deacetylase [Bacilli bacterium]|nr:N-acetylglucosamine-6-phosphate deacetylase [Bacilli bacterium]
MIILKSNKIITPTQIVKGYIYIEKGKIVDVTPTLNKVGKAYDFSNFYIAPGFIDMHTHGGGGHPFINNNVNDVKKACDFHLSHGTTSILPTITAGPFKVMKEALINVIKCKDSHLSKANIIGAHLEGPYLSKAQAGAQCPNFITFPKKSEYVPLIDKYGKMIARWTYAPENDVNGEFAYFLTKHHIIPSIGHSDATYEDVIKAYKKGANLITHLYSCTSTITRNHGFRHLGIVESSYLIDDMYVEIIADGCHLPKELIQLIVKQKSLDKIIACTDSLQITGTNIKKGVMSGTAFIVEDGVCKLKDRSAFAGSIATSDKLLKVLVNDCKLPIVDAIKTLTVNPAKLLNIKKGNIKKGYDADLIIFNDNIKINKVIVNGVFC